GRGRQDAVPLDHDLAGRAGKCRAERGADQRFDRCSEVRQTSCPGAPEGKGGKMRVKPRRAMGLYALSAAWAYGQTTNQAGPQQPPLMADKFFKNVKVLTGIPVNEFMTTMGFFSASLGYSC